MFGKLNPIKDKIISTALKKVLNYRFDGIGEFLSVDFNSTARSLSARLTLKGEDKPLDVHLENYRISPDGERCLVTVGNFKTSKEWLNNLFDLHLKQQTLELPGHLTPIIRMLA